MNRRSSIKLMTSGTLLALSPHSLFSQHPSSVKVGLKNPQAMYINWAAYDELSDNVLLDESLALKQLEEVIRLKKLGVQIDYYMMDAFWFDPDGGYRTWRKKSWPNGGKKWLEMCQENNIKPGLWISTNWMGMESFYKFLNAIPEWQDSEVASRGALSLFEGGYLPHLMESLRMHAKQGIRAFKFDFADFGANTSNSSGKFNKEEIREKNETALIQGLKAFKKEHKEVILMAYNGYGGQHNDTHSSFKKTIDEKWLEVFDTLYCGDPRLADIPTFNFWRSKDIYSDHMVRNYLQNEVPPSRIDNSAFMIGTTGTCYYRRKRAWKGMLILSCSRGGYLNTYYGNLDLLSEEDGKWFAQVQKLFYPLQKKAQYLMVGGIPGKGEVYGYKYQTSQGEVITLVNPAQNIGKFKLPSQSPYQLIFADEGYEPVLEGGYVSIGAEQLLVIGSGEYTQSKYNLGKGDYVKIPSSIEPFELNFKEVNTHQLQATFTPKQSQIYRFIFQILDKDGAPKRVSGGAPPKGISLGKVLQIQIRQGNQNLSFAGEYDKVIWSGLSWASAELLPENYQLNKPLEILFKADIKEEIKIEASVFKVGYAT